MKVVINFSHRWLYTFIVIGILAIIGVGVYAYIGNVGHTSDELDVNWEDIIDMPAGFADGSDDTGGNLSGWSFSNDILRDDGDNVIQTSDEWLRLNQAGQFAYGVHTPGNLNVGGAYQGITCSVSLTGCTDHNSGGATWRICPPNKVVAGLYYSYSSFRMRCCTIAVSCS